MTLSHAEQVVAGIEGMGAEGIRRLDGHARRESFWLEYFRAKCLTDFWTFLRYGLYFGQRKHYCDALHGTDRNVRHYDSSGMASFFSDWTVDYYGERRPIYTKVDEVARIHCKTQEGTIALPIWWFIRDPDEFVLLRSHVDAAVEEILNGIKELVLGKRFQFLFPWLRPQMNGTKKANWTKDEVTFERKVTGVRTPSITAGGFDADVTGHHYTKRVYDDWETKESANSEKLRPELSARFQNDGPLMLGGALTLIQGTTYNPDSFMAHAQERKGIFAEMDYELFVQPAFIQVFNGEFTGQEPILLDDRVTVRCEGAGFPVIEDDLRLCQAKMTFFSPAVKDTVVETREVEWNDGSHFRVNRPIPALLGQPLSYRIGNEKPAAPNRFTLDSVDLLPTDPSIEITRQSLPKMEADLGTYVFSAQMRLQGIDPKSILLDSELLTVIDDSGLPEKSIERAWYRTGDLATEKETGSYTAIVYGFHTFQGYYVMDMQWGNLTQLDIELELVMGQMRALDAGGRLRWTGLEDAHVETVIKKRLPHISRDPYGYFKQAGGKYAEYAKQFLRDVRECHIPLHRIKRKAMMQKTDRIFSRWQPPLQQRRIFVHNRCKHIDRLKEEMTRFRLDSERNLDLIETISDFLHEPIKPREPMEATSTVGENFRQRQQRALMRSGIRRGAAVRWGA